MQEKQETARFDAGQLMGSEEEFSWQNANTLLNIGAVDSDEQIDEA